jgi:putative addiction module component (TIGR02574 family)
MKQSLEQVAEEILRLPHESRAYLAERLLESLDETEDFSVNPAWLAEVKRRLQEIDNGAVKCKTADEVFANLEQELKECRPDSTR